VPRASYSVTISRPLETVFAYIADGEHCSEWRPGVLDIKRSSGNGLGESYSQGVKGPMGRGIAADYPVTVFEPNKCIEFQTTAGPVRPNGRYDFESVESGTRLSFTLDATVTGLRKLLMGSIVQQTMQTEVRCIDNVRKILERQ
jgi:uncharacterized protein YndB with AHSA1/START domain